MMKEIAREEIKDWPLGNVIIKTFSYGDKLKMGSTVKKLFKNMDAVKNEIDEAKIMDNLKDDADIGDAIITLIVAGLHSVKNFDNVQYVIDAKSSYEAKFKFVYDLDFEIGQILLARIIALNKPLNEETKKESS